MVVTFLYFFAYFLISHIILLMVNPYYAGEIQDRSGDFINNACKIVFMIFSPIILIGMLLNTLGEWLGIKDLGYLIGILVLIPTALLICIIAVGIVSKI